jgi:hypothetical protein
VHAWGELAASGVVLQSLLVAEQLDRTFAEVATYAADLVATGPRSRRSQE